MAIILHDVMGYSPSITVVDDFTSKKITAGSLVTVSVTMTRVGLFKHHNIDMERLTSSSDQDQDTPPLPFDGAENVSHGWYIPYFVFLESMK